MESARRNVRSLYSAPTFVRLPVENVLLVTSLAAFRALIVTVLNSVGRSVLTALSLVATSANTPSALRNASKSVIVSLVTCPVLRS